MSNPSDGLEREHATYLREKSKLLADGKEGRWVLIHGDTVDGDWPSFTDALGAGYDRYWPALFMVRQVCEQEPVVSLPASLWNVKTMI